MRHGLRPNGEENIVVQLDKRHNEAQRGARKRRQAPRT